MKKIISTKSLLIILTIICSFLSACSSDDNDDKTKFGNVSIAAGENKVIKGADGTTWTSENKYIAEIENGTLKAHRVGETKLISSKGSFKVNVLPKYSYYKEPYMGWGVSTTSIKNNMKGYTLVGETEKALMYNGKGIEAYVMYLLENSRLNSAAVFIPTSYSDEVVEFLNERYVYGTKEDNYIGMISPDRKILVVITAQKLNSTIYYTVIYGENTSSSKIVQRAKAMNCNKMISNINKETAASLINELNIKLQK